MKKIILLLVLVFGFSVIASANKADDYKQECNNGNSDACFNLGFIYYDSGGVGQDDFKAVEYFKKACNLDNGDGCYFIGLMNEFGFGSSTDYSKVFKYFKKSCKLGNIMGCGGFKRLQEYEIN